jgi:peptidoglycan hydrolase-like protein with peptidoglycan-binding domain
MHARVLHPPRMVAGAMMRRTVGILVSLAVLAGVAVLGYWAGTNAVVPPSLPLASHDPITYTVANGTVGSTLKLSLAASWSTTRTLGAGRGGTVTSVLLAGGAEASNGTVIATIELQPVVVATGSVPMFRTLASGVDGPDVAQLQRLLAAKGFYKGAIDGRFRKSTTSATKLWQRSLGAAQSGVVDAGALLFVDSLPARMDVIPAVGDRVAQGGDFVKVLGSEPGFVASVTADARANLHSGQAISIAAPNGGTWAGTLGTFELQTDGRGGYTASLGGMLCGADCGLVPVAGETALTGTVELVPTTAGPIVPTSALVVQPSGGSAVTLSDGSLKLVTIVAEANGFAVVKGIEPGAVIRLPSPPGS